MENKSIPLSVETNGKIYKGYATPDKQSIEDDVPLRWKVKFDANKEELIIECVNGEWQSKSTTANEEVIKQIGKYIEHYEE